MNESKLERRITLVVDRDPDSGLYWYAVHSEGLDLAFKPGFREREEAERLGDLWIREKLGAVQVPPEMK